MIAHELHRSGSFWSFLLSIDTDLADSARQQGCMMVQREMENPGSPTPGNTPASSSTVRNTLNSLSRVT